MEAVKAPRIISHVLRTCEVPAPTACLDASHFNRDAIPLLYSAYKLLAASPEDLPCPKDSLCTSGKE